MDQPHRKLLSLEALRGLLAVWVLVAHVTSRVVSDATIANAHFKALLEPLTPVYVFMILSGFVIFYLLDRETPSYAGFITRRIFRLAPLYLAVLAVVALLVPFELRTLDNLFMRNSHIYDAIKVQHETLAHFWPHLLVHVFFLQGLISDAWLADANFSFLSQGWSISLEMQFYLIAPLLYWLVRQRRHLALAMVGAGFVALYLLGFPSVGFLPNQAEYFALGIVSYYLYRQPAWFARIPRAALGIGMLVLLPLLYVLLPNPLPVLIWLLVLGLLLANATGRQTMLTRALGFLLERPVLQRLGEVSYSIYLVHIPVLYVVFRAITRIEPHIGGWKFLGLALPLTIALCLPLAFLTYRLIEKPGMEAGRRLAARWGR